MSVKKNYNIQAEYIDSHSNVETRLSIILFQDNEHYIAYAPALDLSGYGYSEEEAHRSLGVALEEFIRYSSNKKTITKELERLGWKVKSQKRMKAPSWQDLITNNDYVADIMENKSFRKMDRAVNIPVMA